MNIHEQNGIRWYEPTEEEDWFEMLDTVANVPSATLEKGALRVDLEPIDDPELLP